MLHNTTAAVVRKAPPRQPKDQILESGPHGVTDTGPTKDGPPTIISGALVRHTNSKNTPKY
jgi:hypothetical protein